MFRISFIAIIVSFLLPSSGGAKEVTVYSHRHYEADDALYAKFTKQTGIKVNIVKASADALLERIKAEGNNSPADVLITADAGRLVRARAAGVLQPATSAKLAAQVPQNMRDADNHWHAFTVRARVLIYSKERVKPSDLSSYEDLAGAKWKGRVVARSSTNIYNQSLLASIVAAAGPDQATAWATAVRGNMARAPEGSDRDQIRAVAAGIADVAIANTYYVGLLANSPDPKDREVAGKIGVFFPNQNGRGAHVNISGGGVVKSAPNRNNAIKLLEFLTGSQAQASFPETTYEYPLDISGTQSKLLKSWGAFKADNLPLQTLGEKNADAVKIFARARWK
ncbi:MAG: Fe(3+) ABC transporter substrate-binding protein [Verrucomicrobiaceae bacterium]|nr:Fe(3+) ABC transporter substrate-binding protein [Verrucomicrobiaceae bacterium]